MGRHEVHIAQESGDRVGLDRVESKAKSEDPHRRENHARRREPRPRSIRRRARCGSCRSAEPPKDLRQGRFHECAGRAQQRYARGEPNAKGLEGGDPTLRPARDETPSAVRSKKIGGEF
jgi:hypothetical protein